MLALLAAAALVAWLYLVYGRGGFWRADRRLPAVSGRLAAWPSVVAVIPARNEAATVGRAVASLLGQDYAGSLSVIVVDDGSEDGTGPAARAAAAEPGRLSVIAARPLPDGWTGKVWAMHEGLAAIPGVAPDAGFVLFTDADVVWRPTVLGRLVFKAEAEGLDLASLMVRLHCASPWERLLVPPFVFFFQKLFPFPWVNDPERSSAAAAGGCMLVRREALARAGGVAPIRDRVIDDCALAGLLKRTGSIWLGLAEDARSLRAYGRLGDIWRMVARTAFAQLGHSVLLLGLTVAGMGLAYLVPPLAVGAGSLSGDLVAVALGGAAWALMTRAYLPTLYLYGRPGAESLRLPLAALAYVLMTLDSARRHWQGEGSAWKGRRYGVRAVGGG